MISPAISSNTPRVILQSISVRFGQADSPAKARRTLDTRGTERRGRVQVGPLHTPDLLHKSGGEGFERGVNRLRETVISEALDRLKTAVTGAVEGLTTLVDAEGRCSPFRGGAPLFGDEHTP